MLYKALTRCMMSVLLGITRMVGTHDGGETGKSPTLEDRGPSILRSDLQHKARAFGAVLSARCDAVPV